MKSASSPAAAAVDLIGVRWQMLGSRSNGEHQANDWSSTCITSLREQAGCPRQRAMALRRLSISSAQMWRRPSQTRRGRGQIGSRNLDLVRPFEAREAGSGKPAMRSWPSRPHHPRRLKSR